MKYRLCIVYTALLVLVMGTTTLHAQDRLVLGFRGGTGALHPVIATRILTEAYGRMGIEIEAREFPGPRLLSKANQGIVDGDLFGGDMYSDQYTNLIRIPVPILYKEIVVFTKDIEFEVEDWDSLRPYRVGILYGNEDVDAKTEGMRVEPVTSLEQLFMKLASGRNDIVVLPRKPGLRALESVIAQHPESINLNTLQGIKVLEPPLQLDFLYHHLHSKHAALVPKITVVLQEMADEGLIQRITEEAEAEF